MIASTQHQSWLFFLPLAQQVALLKDDLLEAVDPLLDDPELIRRMKQSYEQLVALVRQVVRQTGKVRKCWQQGKLPVVGSLSSVTTQMARLEHFLPLVGNVIQQTQQRVFGGNRRVEGKIVSLFEPHSQVIRKGKAHKPNEFGRLVRVDEVENGIVSGYQVLEGNPADTGSFLPRSNTISPV